MSGGQLSAARALLLVGIGAALGGSLRNLLAMLPALLSISVSWPWPLLVINCLGALLIGALAGTPAAWQRRRWALMLLVGPGFCGGLTTFSLFSLEWWQLWQQQGLAAALWWLALTLLAWLLAVSVGFYSVRALTQVQA